MPRTIAFLIFPEFQILDAAGPLAAFELADKLAPDTYRLTVLSPAGGTVASSSGVCWHSEPLAEAGAIDTLILAGGTGTRDLRACPQTRAFLQHRHESVRRLASVCSGAYLLAEAGLLDGRRATTHWARSRDFARRYPAVRLESDRIYIADGKIWTSAGISAGIDLALALIAEDLGEEAARTVARHLVVYHRRPGGQTQHSALLEMEAPGHRFAGLLDHIRCHLDGDLSVETLADRAAMSPRNFARVFRAELGLTPAKAVEKLRAEAARAALESGGPGLQEIARRFGFGDPERMRRAFLRCFGQTPNALRQAFGGTAELR